MRNGARDAGDRVVIRISAWVFAFAGIAGVGWATGDLSPLQIIVTAVSIGMIVFGAALLGSVSR